MKKVQILGPGCAKCKALADNAAAAIEDMAGDYEIEKVTDIREITTFGVMMTPSLAVDGEVKFVGKVASPEEIKKMLE